MSSPVRSHRFRPLDTHFSVVAGEYQSDSDRGFECSGLTVYGTSFALGQGYFLTAAHTLRNAASRGTVALGHRTTACQVIESEYFDDIDLALLRCTRLRDAPVFPVDFEPLAWFAPVQACGYPLAVDPQRLTLVIRAFRGTIVVRRELYGIPSLPAQPEGYELSFSAPQGLSGAPLLNLRGAVPAVSGVIVANQRSEAEGDVTQFGIAVDIRELLRRRSTLLDGWISERLYDRRPLPPGRPTPIRNPLLNRPDPPNEDAE